MIVLPIIATLLYTISTVQRKLFLKQTRIPFAEFFPNLLIILSVMSLIVLPFDAQVDWVVALTPKALLILLTMIGLGVVWWELFFRALREEELGRYDMLVVLDPLAILVMASIFFPAERDVRIWLAGAVAVAALAWAHLNHLRIQLRHGERLLVLAVLISATLVMMQRYLLTIYSPFTLNALLVIGVAILFAWRYGLHWYHDGPGLLRGLALTALLMISNQLFYFYSYIHLGVTVTTLVMLLQPVMVGLIAHYYLKEQLKPKLLLAGVVVLGAVIYALLAVRPQ